MLRYPCKLEQDGLLKTWNRRKCNSTIQPQPIQPCWLAGNSKKNLDEKLFSHLFQFVQSYIVKFCTTSIYYTPTNLRICSHSWDTRVANSQQYCRCQTASSTAQNSKRVCCERSLCSTRLCYEDFQTFWKLRQNTKKYSSLWICT